MSTPTVRELTGPDVALAHAALLELRPHSPAMTSPAALQAWVEAHPDGYRLMGSFEDGPDGEDTQAAAALGFRVMTTLYRGRQLYTDDLVTLPLARGQGHARALLAWAEARRLGCASVELDSGVQRYAAHRQYLKFGLDITSHHFGKVLDVSGARA
ncbi:GNAT family N-acetyltransferase [Deinococcus sp.]|uniref:GNAT family N-acetyltransferase n=1 Tax=Deinococcus sp. TaxID=47478 RepID=UPI0025DBA996|nr:GNAT family N-acetyltransferase [Deinococcus sp.]